MTKNQAKLEIKNSLPQVPGYQTNKFLEHLLKEFHDPEGWLEYIDPSTFRGVIKKHYYRNYKYEKR